MNPIHLSYQGTYDYGKQLLQAALVLRRSLRYEVEPSHERSRRLEEAWRRFSKGTSERANRLTVSAMFLNDSDNVRAQCALVLLMETIVIKGSAQNYIVL